LYRYAAAMVLYSPSALKRIRAFVLGRPAYIVPGVVGDDDRKLAVELGIPLLGPSPEVGLFTSRSKLTHIA
jgi:hypothetical protein